MDRKKTIKLIALDMDGTLLSSDLKVSEENRQAIAEAREKGVQVMLSTGRWIDFCYSYAVDLELDTYIVTVNGGEIWTASKELVERHLHDHQLMEEMWQLGHDLDVYMWLVSTEKVFYDHPGDFSAHEWLKIGYMTEDLDKLKIIRERLSTNDKLEITNSLPTNIEVNPVGVNKANGIERVCEKLGITMDEVMAVGDSLNDIKMIQRAGLGVAMGNAQDKVKQAADFVTDTNDHHGVAKAIRKFVL